MKNKRRDGIRVKGLDGFHNILPYVMPKRTEAEVSITEQFDVTDLMAYMKDRNEKEGTELKIFHAVCTAIARTIYHRPRLNWFISGRYYYERKDITLSFVAKQKFADDADETLMFMKNFVGSLPRPILEIFFGVLRRLEYHGVMPKGLTDGDPNYSTVLLANLGSIRSESCYHHLNNYGTCSCMVTIGVVHKEQKHMPDGSVQERDVLNCTVTLDERLSDGFYNAKSLKIVKYLLEHPKVLEEEIREPVPVEL